jgi:hypothetical protein
MEERVNIISASPKRAPDKRKWHYLPLKLENYNLQWIGVALSHMILFPSLCMWYARDSTDPFTTLSTTINYHSLIC